MTGLNAAQTEAVHYLNGPCLVLAGAGSGKTRVITQKIAYLLDDCSYDPQRVAALTFTNKAALEMTERIKRLCPQHAVRGLTVSTFHSLGVRFLRQEAAHLGLKPSFSILDAEDATSILKDLSPDADRRAIKQLQQAISRWKNALVSPAQAQQLAADVQTLQEARLYQRYVEILAAYQAVDFDDLIRLPAVLLASQESVRQRWQSRFNYLLIDEYQDTNPCQYRLVQWLTGPRAMFTAVGDDDQAIYAWRGASVENIKRLTLDFTNLHVVKLEQNYRSTQRILSAANAVIAHNPKLFAKKLWSALGVGDSITVTAYADDVDEAESVVMRMSTLRFERRLSWRDFAVLYRSNQQSRVFEQALRQLNIPYVMSGGQSFFDRAEIRDICAYLRLIANDDDDPAFIRAVTTPKRGIGQSTLETLGEYASRRRCGLFAAVFESGVETVLPARQLGVLREFCTFIQRMQWRADKGASGGAESVTDTSTAATGDTVGELLNDLLQAIAYEAYLYDQHEARSALNKWRNVTDLVAWLGTKAQNDDLTLTGLVQHIALVTLLERQENDDPDALRLSTLHAAKGLEFPHVFLVGCEEGLMPHQGVPAEVAGIDGAGNETSDDALAKRSSGVVARQDVASSNASATTSGPELGSPVDRIEEERRLMYVGITRAQRSLHITWCKTRKRAKQTLQREPSRFIAEMRLDDAGPQVEDAAPEATPKDRLSRLKALLKRPEPTPPSA